MGFAPSKPWKWPCITHSDGCRNRKPPIDSAEQGKNECHPEQSWARFLRPTESKGICGSNGTNMSRTSETGQGCPESKVQFTNVVILSVAKRSRRILSLRYHLIRQPHH